jgi:hypothetical protein
MSQSRDALQGVANHLIARSVTVGTEKSYDSTLTAWFRFAKLARVDCRVFNEKNVLLFIAHRFAIEEVKGSTIAGDVSALSYWAMRANRSFAGHTRRIARAIEGAKRLRPASDGAPAMSIDSLTNNLTRIKHSGQHSATMWIAAFSLAFIAMM